jgi:hypothetical protein
VFEKNVRMAIKTPGLKVVFGPGWMERCIRTARRAASSKRWCATA